MVDEDAVADAGCGVDVDAEHFRGAVLQKQRQRFATLVPQPVGYPMGLQGVEALEVEKRF